MENIQKKLLYNKIMNDITKKVKKLMENYSENDDDIIEVFHPSYGTCTVRYCYDVDNSCDFYEVTDEDGNFICEIPFDTNINDEDDILDAIDNNIDNDYDFDN